MRKNLIKIGVIIMAIGAMFAISPLFNGEPSIFYDQCVSELRSVRGIVIDGISVLLLSVGGAILYTGLMVHVIHKLAQGGDEI